MSKFIDGLFFNLPNEKAPDFVKGSLGIHRDKLIDWLSQQEVNEKGYIDKIDLKVSKEGKPYAQVNDYKKSDPSTISHSNAPGGDGEGANFKDDEIPF